MNCPKCDGQNAIFRATIRSLAARVYVCERCDALWTHPDTIGPSTAIPLKLFLGAQHIPPSADVLENKDHHWDRASDPLQELRADVEADPSAVPARLQLASLLLDAGEPAEAIEHSARVLQQEPANLQALYIAAQAAAALGDTVREDGYRRLIRALSGISDAPGVPGVAQSRPGTADGMSGRMAASEAAETDDRVALPAHDEAADTDDLWPSERSWVTLADVGGMDSVKQRLTVAFLAPLRNPEFREMYGKSLRGGLLLYGPPGCGKTYIARALAGELAASFIAVGLSDVLDMWLGQSEQRLHHIFEAARRRAPCVVFFDEIDALGQKRSQLKHSAGRNVVNQLLSELDGIGSDNEGVFILGATNHPWDVDSALVRPGRFDRMILVLPPDEPARAAILRSHLASRPAGDVDTSWIAARTDGFSGADLAHLCETATEYAMTDSLTSGTMRPLATSDVKRALKDLRPSTRAWFDIARNYALFANEGGAYDELLAYMRVHKLL